MNNRYSCIIFSDFTITSFARYLEYSGLDPVVSCRVFPYEDLFSLAAVHRADYGIVWTQPQRIFSQFQKLWSGERVPFAAVAEEVSHFAAALEKLSSQVSALFVPTWVVEGRGLGMLDMRVGIGIGHTVWRMNLLLAEILESKKNIYLFDTMEWLLAAQQPVSHPKLWYGGKVPFTNGVFYEAGKEIQAAIWGLSGRAKKMIIVDLDNTLWGEVVGEVGWKGLLLGGHDAVGEAFVDFQRGLQRLQRRGIMLGIVSKNVEAVALEAIEKHPEMILRLDDFVGWKINFEDKAQNIIDLVKKLNIGLDSVVFIDDSPAERLRVSEALPEILVPEWPQDVLFYQRALSLLTCFDSPFLSSEDSTRTTMYVTQRKRNKLQSQSIEEWLDSLQTEVVIERLKEENLSRVVQLLNKTNQMNLQTRRLTAEELIGWLKKKRRRLFTFRVKDVFGDAGLVGILSLEVSGKAVTIVDFVLSCRVMNRKIEETMAYIAKRYAQSLGLKKVMAHYVATAKNVPCFTFWQRSGFQFDKQTSTFQVDSVDELTAPPFVQIHTEDLDFMYESK